MNNQTTTKEQRMETYKQFVAAILEMNGKLSAQEVLSLLNCVESKEDAVEVITKAQDMANQNK